MSYNYSSCQKKSEKSDPGFKFTGQRSFKICQGVKLEKTFSILITSICKVISLHLKKKINQYFHCELYIFTKLMSLGEAG